MTYLQDAVLVLDDIAADFCETYQPDCLYFMGAGTTVAALMDALGIDNSLIGIDAIYNQSLLAADLNADQIDKLLDQYPGPVKLVLTVIGGQGHILGRGNQQLTPAIIRRIGIDNLLLVASKGKIAALDGRPLLVDSGDAALDAALSAYHPLITGYHDAILYPVSAASAAGDREQLDKSTDTSRA